MSHPFDRYSAFTDLSALTAASGRPLRKSIRVNTLKCSVADFRQWAKEKGWSLSPVPWCAEGFFIERENRETALGRDLRHLLGHFYMQESASMLPAVLLYPRPGETILDLCAAPGSKTTQIAAKIACLTPQPPLPCHSACPGRGGATISCFQVCPKKESVPPLRGGFAAGSERGIGGEAVSGIVVANDVQEKRLWVLNDAIQRTGATNAVIVRKVGQWYAKQMTERFDRVLCDAPCTAQGTARKDSDALRYCSPESIAKMARLQRSLLESAVHACRVGGRIVYSTCTLTPEENESVLLEILNKFSDQLEVVHPNEALPPGLDWDMSATISDSELVQRSLGPKSEVQSPFLRLWPQTYDTEGFFCAVLRKVKPTRAPAPHHSRSLGCVAVRGSAIHDEPMIGGNATSVSACGSTRHPEPVEFVSREAHVLTKAKRAALEKMCAEQYGTTFLLPGDLLIERGQQVLLTTEGAFAFTLSVREYAQGVPFAKILSDNRFRLASDAVQLRGHLATKGIMDLSAAQMAEVLAGKDIPCDAALHGDVLVQHCGMTLGLSLAKGGALMNRLPRWVVKLGIRN